MAWNFQREESNGFQTNIPEGAYRIRVKSAEKGVSKTGNDMLILQFDVSGFNETLYHYIVFLPDRPEITNRNLTQFFDAFKDIPLGEFDTSKWIGKVGACQIKHEDYQGNPKAKIHYFIKEDKQAELAPWKEPEGSNQKGNGDSSFVTVSDEDIANLPF